MPLCKQPRIAQRIISLALLILLAGCQANQEHLTLDEAGKELQTMLEKDKQLEASTVEEALKKARIAWLGGKIDLAQALYIKAYNLDPANTRVLEEMAKIYRQLNKTDLAEVCYRLILQQQPKNLAILESYALLLMQRKKFPQAEQALQQVIVADKKSWKAYNGLGIIADMQGLHPKAQAFFAQARAIQPNHPEILNNIGYSLYMDDQLTDAQNYFLQALKIDPGFKKALYNYALIEARKKNYPEALAVFTKVVSLPEANNNTGYAAMMNGDLAEADYYLNQALKLSPRFYSKAHENLNELDTRKIKASIK